MEEAEEAPEEEAGEEAEEAGEEAEEAGEEEAEEAGEEEAEEEEGGGACSHTMHEAGACPPTRSMRR